MAHGEGAITDDDVSDYLGFDTERLGLLRDAMLRCVDELDGIKCTDALAQRGRDAIHSARSMLSDRWIALIGGLLGCQAMIGYRPIHLPIDDLTLGRLLTLQQYHGWQATTDPMAPPPTVALPWMTPQQAADIARLLSDAADPAVLLSVDELAWLDRALQQIGVDPALAATFFGAMTPDGWNRLMDDVASAELWAKDPINAAQLTAEDLRYNDALDRVIAGLAATIPATDTHLDVATSDLLAGMQPYGAALLVSRVDLGAADLAAVTARLLERWHDEQDPNWADVLFDGPNTADLLFVELLATAGGAAAFRPFATSNPTVLFATASGSTLAEQLALEITTPLTGSDRDIGAAITSWIDYLHGGLYDWDAYTSGCGGEYRSLLGTIVAPWLLQFTNRQREDFGLEFDEGAELLRTVMSEAAAAERLTGAYDAALQAFERRIPDDPHAAVDHLDAVTTLLRNTVTSIGIERAEQRERLWGLVTGLFEKVLTTLVLFAAPVSKKVAGIGTAAFVSWLESYGRDNGWSWIPPRLDDAKDAARWENDWSAAVTTAAIATMSYDRLVATRVVGASTPPPPLPDPASDHPDAEFLERLDAWHSQLPPEAQDEGGRYRESFSAGEAEAGIDG